MSDIYALAKQLSLSILPSYFDTNQREKVEALLLEFAAEIKRSAIEP